MKKVLILFGRSDWEKNNPFRSKQHRLSYECFYDLCEKKGIQLCRASYEWYDYKKNIFKYAWIFESENNQWKRIYNIRPNLIYDKTKDRLENYYLKELMGKRFLFINNRLFTQIIGNKLTTSLLFPKWSKKSWLVDSKTELTNALAKIKTSLIVAKPLSESGGKNVIIGPREDLLKKKLKFKDCLVQEFIDSSEGVPGISKGEHDLRIVCVNDKIIYSFIREPKKGSHLANLAQGGSLTIIPNDKIPASIKPIFQYANNLFKTFGPRIYSIDFMFDKKQNPWIVELNSMPGLYFTPEEKPYMIELYKELIKVFQKKLMQKNNH